MKRILKIVLIILFILTVFVHGCTLSGQNKSIKVKFFVKKRFSESVPGSRIIFSENNSLFMGDLKGKVLKIASFLSNGCEVGVDGISNDGRWVIYEVSLGDSNSSNSVSYVYALDLANLNYFKVTVSGVRIFAGQFHIRLS